MLTGLLYPLQDGYTTLHYAAREGHTTCVECLLSTPGIYVNLAVEVSQKVTRYCFISSVRWGMVREKFDGRVTVIGTCRKGACWYE